MRVLNKVGCLLAIGGIVVYVLFAAGCSKELRVDQFGERWFVNTLAQEVRIEIRETDPDFTDMRSVDYVIAPGDTLIVEARCLDVNDGGGDCDNYDYSDYVGAGRGFGTFRFVFADGKAADYSDYWVSCDSINKAPSMEYGSLKRIPRDSVVCGWTRDRRYDPSVTELTYLIDSVDYNFAR